MIRDGTLDAKGVSFPEELFGGSQGDELLSDLESRWVTVSHVEK
jgi:hypothetical protein